MVNEFFCEPPMSQREVKQKSQSAAGYQEVDPGPYDEPTDKSADKPHKETIVVLDKFIPRPFSEQLLKEYSFRCEGTRGTLWHFQKEEGIWLPDGRDTVRNILRTKFNTLHDSMKKRNCIEEILADLEQCCYSRDGLPTPALTLIPCKNGVYDLDQGKLIPYSPDQHFTSKLPWNYVADGQAAFLCKLLDDTLPDGGSIDLYELLSYCLWRGYPVQRFWIFVGPGANGKGVTTTIFTRLLGASNVSNITLQNLQGDHFAAAWLCRKLANIGGEVSYTALENTSLLKSLTGGDRISADRKYLEPITFENHAKLIFSTNSVPVTRDTTDAFYRRSHVVVFPRRFEINPEIDVKLREESPYMTEQYEGLLKLAIGHLQRLRTQGFRFTREPSVEVSKALYQRLSNPLARFIHESCFATHEHSDFIYKFEFYDRLNAWLRAHDFMTMTPESTGKAMKELGIDQGKRSSPQGDKLYTAFCGIRWLEPQSGLAGQSGLSQTFPLRAEERVIKSPDIPDTPDVSAVGQR